MKFRYQKGKGISKIPKAQGKISTALRRIGEHLDKPAKARRERNTQLINKNFGSVENYKKNFSDGGGSKIRRYKR